MRNRTAAAWGVAIVCFVVLMLVTPKIPQSQEYHDFADQREFFGNFTCPVWFTGTSRYWIDSLIYYYFIFFVDLS